MNGKQLRNSILQWAIRGRLVPQDPNDEPAIELLKRINPKAAPITEELPFSIPDNWCWVRLGSLCVFLSRGKSPKYSEERKYPVFAQKCNLKDGGISLEPARFLDPSTIDKWKDVYKLRNGDVLVNSTGTGTVCRTRMFDEKCLGDYPFVVPDSHVSVVRTYEEINSTFVLYYISSRNTQQYLEDNLAGSTNQKELYIGVLENLLIPLPPLAEQERIVNEVERWFACIEQLERSREALGKAARQTKRTLLSLAIAGCLVPQDPNDEPAIELLKRINPKFTPQPTDSPLPPGWTACGYKDIFSNITSKPYQILQSQIMETGKTPVISQSASYIEGYSNEDCLLQHDEPLIVFGDHTKVVKYVDFDFIVGADGVKIIEPLINRKYAFYLLLYASTHIYDRGYARHFSLISKFVFLVPPLAEQERIVGKVEAAFAALDSLR